MDQYDIAVIGSGPGGYVAAIRAAQHGMKTVLIEKEAIGGVCLNWGCIPTKAIIHSVNTLRAVREASGLGILVNEPKVDMSRIIARSRDVAERLSKGIAHLMKKNNVHVVEGRARLEGERTIRTENKESGEVNVIRVEHIILATGSRQKELPHLPIDGKKVIGSRHALELSTLPASLAIIGAGAIGVEFAYIYRHLGVEVTLIEAMDTLLPNEDEEISQELLRQFKKQKIVCHVGSKLLSLSETDDGLTLTLEGPKGEKELQVQQVLSAVGVRANTEDLGLETLGVAVEKGFIAVDGDQQTNVKGIYAIGDVAGNPCLAHKAGKEARIVIDHISGKKTVALDRLHIPACTYCEPQVASVGMREKDALEKNIVYEVSKVAYRAMGKAVAMDRIDGFLKLVFEKNTKKIIGAHCIGSEATELIAELTLSVTRGMTLSDLAETIHAHPTLSELIPETAELGLGEAIHV
ncbi:MAG: dihydrolipoyl dehydrogenase [FCB group bacterium]|nr:dihydrolipoyl dehydrogenase [FCB group bacterium]